MAASQPVTNSRAAINKRATGALRCRGAPPALGRPGRRSQQENKRHMRYLILVTLLTAWTCLAPQSPARAEGPVFPPGLRIGLEPAGTLAVSRRFPGFEDADRHVVVGIFDLPAAAYEQLSRSAFSPDQQGLANAKRENFPFAGGIGVLVSGMAQADGTQMHRWFLVTTAAPAQAKDLAMMVRVEVPEAAHSVYTDAVVRKMLASIAFRELPIEELLGLLPFKVTDLAGFRVLKVVPDGVIVIDGAGDDLSKQSYAVITVGRGAPDDAADRGRFARNLMTSAPLRDLELTSADAMRIGGTPGFEIRGQAKGLKDEPVKLVQWLRFGSVGGGFLRIVAVAGTDQWDATFNRFRALRDGVTLR